MEREDSDDIEAFLKKVQQGSKREVKKNFCRGEKAIVKRDSQSTHSKELLKALNEGDAFEVWRLIAENQFVETLENLNSVCDAIREKENEKEAGCIKYICSWIGKKKLSQNVKSLMHWFFAFHKDHRKIETEMQSEKEAESIEILSNPLYISLEWLWRNKNYPKSQPYSKEKRRKESKFTDIIEAALDDSYLLEKIASYEHHYSKEEYKQRALKYEEFATDIVNQVKSSDLKQLHEIMDIDGSGSLRNEKPDNFIQSVSLLKTAADKQRKKFVASPKCQYILNEIIYFGCRDWQDKGIFRKTLSFFLQLLLVTVAIPIYIPVRLIRRGCCCHEFGDWCLWKFRMLFEHPYSKFINHTMSYVVFLCLIFASSFEDKFGQGWAGFAWIDYIVLPYVAGLLLQEAQEALRQGLFIYFSKWWNVVDTVIVSLFLSAYILWGSAWLFYGDWKPEKVAFMVADGIYASGTVVSFFHLAHIFQVSSVLGPLQLSLYRMLKEVLKFLAIFFLLFIAFATGVAKIFTYYVASQEKLRAQENTHHQTSHPYATHSNTLIVLFWLLFGGGGEEKNISVEDPRFTLTSDFGRLFMIAYAVCTIFTALNMLVAMMNNSYNKIMQDAELEWKFSRTLMWLEWIDKGNTIPVPFNIVYFVGRPFFKVIGWCCCCCERRTCKKQSYAEEQVKGNADKKVKDLEEQGVDSEEQAGEGQCEEHVKLGEEEPEEARVQVGQGKVNSKVQGDAEGQVQEEQAAGIPEVHEVGEHQTEAEIIQQVGQEQSISEIQADELERNTEAQVHENQAGSSEVHEVGQVQGEVESLRQVGQEQSSSEIQADEKERDAEVHVVICQEQGSVHAQEGNQGQNCCFISSRFFCGWKPECVCCTKEKHSMRDERMEEMKKLVVEYLKTHYSERWREHRQKYSREASDRQKAQSVVRGASLESVHVLMHSF